VDPKARAAQWDPAGQLGCVGLWARVVPQDHVGPRASVVPLVYVGLRACRAVVALKVGAGPKARAVRWVHAGQRASVDQQARVALRGRVVRSGLSSGKTSSTL
jgi:hypothetical protein